MLVLTLWSALAVYILYVLVSGNGGRCLSNLARPPAKIFVHVTQEAEAATQDGNGNSLTSVLIRVIGALWSGDKEIAEDWLLGNNAVVA